MRKGFLLVAVAAALLGSAAVAEAATTRVTPSKGQPGAKMKLVGQGFPRAQVVFIQVGPKSMAVRTNRRGVFKTSFRVPKGFGGKRLVARSGATRVVNVIRAVKKRPLVSSSSTAHSDGRRVYLTPVGGRMGDRVTVKGTRFANGSRVVVKLAGETMATRVVRKRKFTARFDVADGASPGKRRIAVAASPAIKLPFRVACGTRVRVCAAYKLNFRTDKAGIKSANRIGTGFTMVLQKGGASGHVPANVRVNAEAGRLDLTTTAGLFDASGTQDNALGVGIDAGNGAHTLRTVLLDPPAGSGGSEQGGLWFAISQTRFIKLVLISTNTGQKVQLRYVEAGQSPQAQTTGAIGGNIRTLALLLRLDPEAETITGRYSVNGGAFQTVGTVENVPGDYFNADAAGIDPSVGTRVFGGVFASHRQGPGPLVYKFNNFTVTRQAAPPPPPPPPGEPAFTRTHVPNVFFPTSIAWAPKAKRLYVTELTGKIHWIEFNAARQVTDRGTITTLGTRLTLGITVDPASTAGNTILWVTHSHPPTATGSLKNSPPNSGIVSRLAQGNGYQRQDKITGLPRSGNDHAVNSLHFGSDGKLYIAVGGNTGAGAKFEGDNEFQDGAAEQPLSAAIIVANVKAAAFPNTANCNNSSNIYAPPPCMNQGWVVPWATGLRNAYDFVFHSNGHMYAPDNGLGLRGMFPPRPTAPCNAFHSAYDAAFDPGGQHDFLYRVVPGKYHGHPNPSRGECVFKDGSWQGVATPNYQPPILDLTNHRSANSTIEYKSNVFGGGLKGEILIANWANGDNISRTRLSANGQSVVNHEILAVPRPGGESTDFGNPLGMAQSPDGTIYVGDSALNRISVLRPNP